MLKAKNGKNIMSSPKNWMDHFWAILSIIVYGFIFIMFYDRVGGGIAAFGVLPVITVAWLWGLKAGILFGLLMFAINTILFNIVEPSGISALIDHHGIPGNVSVLFIGAAVGYMHNLRKRLRGELNSRIEAEVALKQSEQNFRNTFESSSEGLNIVSTITGRFIEVNQAMCDMFGYTREEMLELFPNDLGAPEDKEKQSEALKILMSGGKIENHEGKRVKKDGSYFHALISAQPLTWKDEQVFLGSIRDISRIKEYQEQIKAKNKEIREFTDVITHDLRNPLAAIKNIYTLFKHDKDMCKLSMEGQEILTMGNNSINYMQELLEDLLDCAKLEAGIQNIECEEINIWELVDTVAQRLMPQIHEKNITVTRDVDGHVYADKKGLTKVFMNLIGNAIKYIGDTPDPQIIISSQLLKDDTEYHLSVKDNGLGIPRQIQNEIFNKFKRGVNVSAIKGTGMGLSIVKGVVEAHGGKVWLESKEGEGTHVYFTLPKTSKTANL